MHFGGDEAAKECWEFSPTLRATKKSTAQLQGDFTKRVQGFAQQNGKVPVLWDEVQCSLVYCSIVHITERCVFHYFQPRMKSTFFWVCIALWLQVLSLPTGSVPANSIIQMWRFWSGHADNVNKAQRKGYRTLQSKSWYISTPPTFFASTAI
jgi:hypothetical protein